MIAAPAQQLVLELARPVAAGDGLHGARVDRQRVRAHPHLAAVGNMHDAGLVIDLAPEQVLAALQEVPPVGAGVEADDVVGQDPVVDLLADHRREHPPRVRLGPRDVHEVGHEHVRADAADQPGERVQVVVVDHHDRPLEPLDLLHHRPRQVLVDGVVAELERLGLVAADVRRVRQVPQVVLDEPQHRVRGDVVEAVVGVGVGRDQLDPVLAAARRLHGERLALVALGDGRVLLGHRRRDPGHVAVGGEADQRGHQAAGARAEPRRPVRTSPALDSTPARAGDQKTTRRSDLELLEQL